MSPAEINVGNSRVSPIRKVARRLIPFMFVLYIVAYLDRINLGFAAGQMKVALGFDDDMLGKAGSVFFVGYFVFQVPSNLILERLGARRWIGIIMISWGFVSGLEAFVRSPQLFYVLRFLLGVAEAGFFPGMILYLTYWFPQRERARAVSSFMTAIPCAGVLGGVISGQLLKFHGMGFEGWQWLFILEAAPAIMLGAVVHFYLTDTPAQAHWLSAEERAWLVRELAEERANKTHKAERTSIGDALFDGRVWLLSLLYFSLTANMYGIGLWLPQMIVSFVGVNEIEVGLLTAIPYLLAAGGMVWVGHHSDRTGERRRHVALSALLGALGFFISALAPSAPVAVVGFSIAAFGLWGTVGPFWALPTAFLGGTAAAGGIAIINSVGNLGGSFGVYAIGWLKQSSHSFVAGIGLMVAMMLLAALLAMLVRAQEEQRFSTQGTQNARSGSD